MFGSLLTVVLIVIGIIQIIVMSVSQISASVSSTHQLRVSYYQNYYAARSGLRYARYYYADIPIIEAISDTYLYANATTFFKLPYLDVDVYLGKDETSLYAITIQEHSRMILKENFDLGLVSRY